MRILRNFSGRNHGDICNHLVSELPLIFRPDVLISIVTPYQLLVLFQETLSLSRSRCCGDGSDLLAFGP